MRDAFTRVLNELARQDKNLYLVTGDLGFGVLRAFSQDFPDRFINAGIAVQLMTSMAAGMSLVGKTVFTYSIGNFPTLRCIEQIRNDCAYHEANVKIVCVGGGFVYGSLGMSHHATEDVALLRALPGVCVMSPGDKWEAEAATRAVYAHKGTCYLRLGRGGEPEVHSGPIQDFQVGRALTLYGDGDVALLSSGGILAEAKRAADALRGEGVGVSLYSFPCVKPIDTALIARLTRSCRHIFTVEEHTIVGGFGSAVCEAAASLSARCAVTRIGMNDCYSSIVGTQDYLREQYGMSAAKIAQAVRENL